MFVSIDACLNTCPDFYLTPHGQALADFQHASNHLPNISINPCSWESYLCDCQKCMSSLQNPANLVMPFGQS